MDTTTQGHRIFAEELAAQSANKSYVDQPHRQQLAQIAAMLRAPIRVVVRGRAGVGCRTLIHALDTIGISAAVGTPETVRTGECPGTDIQVAAAGIADIKVYVLAETLKPEDRHALADNQYPQIVVLNKADLTGRQGSSGAGPLTVAAQRCQDLHNDLHDGSCITVLPLVALLAVASHDIACHDTVFDETMLNAVRILAVQPADLGSADGFVQCSHQIARPVRQRLLDALDLFGIAHAVHVVRHGGDRVAIHAAMRTLSGVDMLLAALDRAAAVVYYQRIVAAVAALTALAAKPGGQWLGEFLVADAVIEARMAAAVTVIRAANNKAHDMPDCGNNADDGDDERLCLRRAVQWQRYSRAEVNPLHRVCGADISRGWLRLWERAGGSAQHV